MPVHGYGQSGWSYSLRHRSHCNGGTAAQKAIAVGAAVRAVSAFIGINRRGHRVAGATASGRRLIQLHSFHNHTVARHAGGHQPLTDIGQQQ